MTAATATGGLAAADDDADFAARLDALAARRDVGELRRVYLGQAAAGARRQMAALALLEAAEAPPPAAPSLPYEIAWYSFAANALLAAGQLTSLALRGDAGDLALGDSPLWSLLMLLPSLLNEAEARLTAGAVQLQAAREVVADEWPAAFVAGFEPLTNSFGFAQAAARLYVTLPAAASGAWRAGSTLYGAWRASVGYPNPGERLAAYLRSAAGLDADALRDLDRAAPRAMARAAAAARSAIAAAAPPDVADRLRRAAEDALRAELARLEHWPVVSPATILRAVARAQAAEAADAAAPMSARELALGRFATAAWVAGDLPAARARPHAWPEAARDLERPRLVALTRPARDASEGAPTDAVALGADHRFALSGPVRAATHANGTLALLSAPAAAAAPAAAGRGRGRGARSKSPRGRGPAAGEWAPATGLALLADAPPARTP